MSAIQLVGSLGVGPMPLVGGPLDGEIRVAVVGAPLVVAWPEKAEPNNAGVNAGDLARWSSLLWGMGRTAADEGESWKEAKPSAIRTTRRRFAIYAPRLTDNRWTLALFFVGPVEVELPEDAS